MAAAVVHLTDKTGDTVIADPVLAEKAVIEGRKQGLAAFEEYVNDLGETESRQIFDYKEAHEDARIALVGPFAGG